MTDEQQREQSPQEPRWKRLLGEAWRGIVGNTAYDILKYVIGLALGSGLWSLIQHALASAIPALREFLSAKIVIPVGTITAVSIPVLILIVVWIISAYRGRARRKESRQIITELNQRTAELAQHRAELETERRKLRDEKAKVENTTTALVALSQHVLGLCDDKVHDANSLDWSGAVAASERADRCAREALSHHVTKAVYYDPNYPGSWMKASIAEQTRDFFVNRWFVEKDAQQLKHWINQLLQDGEHAFPGRGRLTPEQEHVRQLERENKILRQERDILKKAVAIFSHPRK